MSNEEELNRYMALLEQYKEQMKNLEMQYNYVQNAINDYNRAKITLENISKAEKNSDVLLPIGGSTFIYAEVKNPKKVLFDIGSGLAADKDTKDAVKSIDKRLNDLQKTLDKISNMIQQTQSESENVTKKAQQLMSDQQGF